MYGRAAVIAITVHSVQHSWNTVPGTVLLNFLCSRLLRHRVPKPSHTDENVHLPHESAAGEKDEQLLPLLTTSNDVTVTSHLTTATAPIPVPASPRFQQSSEAQLHKFGSVSVSDPADLGLPVSTQPSTTVIAR